MSYQPARRALDKWMREKLHASEPQGERREFSFDYTGSLCRDGGAPLQGWLRASVGMEEAGPVLLAFRIEVRGDPAPFRKLCNPGAEQEKDLCARLGVAGMSLQAILDSERPSTPAGCFCEDPMLLHKLQMLCATILHYLRTEASSQAPPAP